MEQWELDEKEFLRLLTLLIGETENLQNSPPTFIPSEDKAGQHVLAALKPFSTENGGPLKVEHIAYVEGRGNIIISYPGDKTLDKTVAFVGSHLDVVPADPKTWERNPFQLTVEGDKLYGRGTTDCLGHVALLTNLFLQLAQKKPELKVQVVAVFIASEESDIIPGVGVDMLLKNSKLDFLKKGPVYWVDSADSQPCIGTASAATWHLKVSGKLFHSGLPHKAINSIELGSEALKAVQDKFYQEFPPHPEEKRYNFLCPSSMKPTRVTSSAGSLNQIPPQCTFSGDIRLTPFYEVDQVKETLNKFHQRIEREDHIFACQRSLIQVQFAARRRQSRPTGIGVGGCALSWYCLQHRLDWICSSERCHSGGSWRGETLFGQWQLAPRSRFARSWIGCANYWVWKELCLSW
eukprot:TRINITY_DN8246_c0_g2_i1.p1 TRINITY_DN8246_c0_g2~~TRINITY_DN8246_c0_g2_i1.p1  ORF type:complete len:421 (-),score=115.15 TRINITY_DN8246_c0_g2_i1:291-1511(-)